MTDLRQTDVSPQTPSDLLMNKENKGDMQVLSLHSHDWMVNSLELKKKYIGFTENVYYMSTNLLTAQLPPLVDIRLQWVQIGCPVAAVEQLHAAIPSHCCRLGGHIEAKFKLLSLLAYWSGRNYEK